MECVLDTCALVWCTTAADRLAPAAREIASDPGSRFVLSSISLWEVALKCRRGKLDIGTGIREYVGRLRRLANLEIVDVTPEIWLTNVELDWEHRDPADRTIVATASLRELPIMTRDERIIGFYESIVEA